MSVHLGPNQAQVGTVSAFVPRRRELPNLTGERVRVALVSPRFEPAFYGQDYMLPLLPGDVRALMSSGALPLLAALVPPSVEVSVFDENVTDLDFEQLRGFHIVGVTGMIVQRSRMQSILLELHDHTGLIVVGGAYVSVDEAFFSGLCDVVFVGEADVTWPSFLQAVVAGKRIESRYRQAVPTDMTTLPLPRYELLETHRYGVAAVQFSRGCPFMCEFCDIITIFGRKPRSKSPPQVISELERLRDLGFSEVFLVDDNFIGNKKLAKELLRELVEWQRREEYPLRFTTEASINLADEGEILRLMFECNFRSVFIGIESPNADALEETRKVQNVKGDSLLAKVQRVRDAGLVIQGGFMVGFDSDRPEIFDSQFSFIQSANIAQAAVGILCAIPSTPLYERLRKEGRLRPNDPNCNFVPKQMTSEVLQAGYLRVTEQLYSPRNYFARVFGSWSTSPQFRSRWDEAARRQQPLGFLARLGRFGAAMVTAFRLTTALARDGELRSTGWAYVGVGWHYRREVFEGVGWSRFVFYCAQHWHYYKLYRETRRGSFAAITTYSYLRGDLPSRAMSA